MYREPLKRTSPEAMGIPSAAVQKLIEKLEVSGTEMHGFMLTRHGAVVSECWWAPYHRDLVHICHSLGKSYVVTAIGAACTDGLLSMDDKIADLFQKELADYGIEPSENLKKLTVRDVAAMTNGMSVHALPFGDFIRNYFECSVDYEPGTRFMYNSTGSCMLGAVVQKVTGKYVKEYLTERIFETIGIEPEKLGWIRFRNGVDGAPGVSTTTENNLRLGMLYLNGGNWNGTQLLDPAWVREATRKQSDNSICNTHPDSCSGYGYQMWMCRKPGAYRFDGGHGQLAVMDTETDTVIAIHQGASMPACADGVLDILNDFLCSGVFADAALPADPKSEAILRDYERKRALPPPKTAAVPPDFADWNGLWKVTEGKFHLNPELRPFDTLNFYLEHYVNQEPDVKTMSIEFKSPSLCELVMDHKFAFQATLDGEVRLVHTGSEIPEYYLSCASAYFEDENTLVFTVRYIQTCFISYLRLHRNGDEMEISLKKTTLHEASPFISDCAKAVRKK